VRVDGALDLRFEESVAEFVEVLDGLGPDHVEVRQGYPDVHPDAPSPRDLRDLAAATGVTYTFHAPFRGANLGNPDEPLRAAAVDVGHATVTGVDPGAFVDRVVGRFGDRVHVAHLHDNDGRSDRHDPLPGYERVASRVGAEYNVPEMKSIADVRRCVEGVSGR
jgi:sugar phosphate isomerase/epimerase